MTARFPLCGILGMVLWGAGCGVEAPEGKVSGGGGEGKRVEGAVPPPTGVTFQEWCEALRFDTDADGDLDSAGTHVELVTNTWFDMLPYLDPPDTASAPYQRFVVVDSDGDKYLAGEACAVLNPAACTGGTTSDCESNCAEDVVSGDGACYAYTPSDVCDDSDTDPSNDCDTSLSTVADDLENLADCNDSEYAVTVLHWAKNADGDSVTIGGDTLPLFADDSIVTVCTSPGTSYAIVPDDCYSSAEGTTPESLKNKCVDCDDDDPERSNAPAWYEDADGDGFGTSESRRVRCEQPSGYVSNSDDCDDTDGDLPKDFCEDSDGDGYYGESAACEASCVAPTTSGYTVSTGGDCDEIDGSRYPENTELCDGKDNDCNDVVDNISNELKADGETPEAGGATAYWPDYDGDGYGSDVADGTAYCPDVVPDGDGYVWVANHSDCDDANVDAHPGGSEICDYADNDCDGSVDNGTDVKVWHFDSDGDGYGIAEDPVTQCYQPVTSFPSPAKYVVLPVGCTEEDCADVSSQCCDCNDDAAPEISPAAAEVCDDAEGNTDENCNGKADDDDDTLTGDLLTYYYDFDHDGYAVDPGDVESGVEYSVDRCDATGKYTVTAASPTDCDDSEGAVNPGADEVCDGSGFDTDTTDVDNDCNGHADNFDLASISTTASGTGLKDHRPDRDGDLYGDGTTGAAVARCPGIDESMYTEDGSVITSGYDYLIVPESGLVDCDDGVETTYPGAPDYWYDGYDTDCGGESADYDCDFDGDGVPCNETATNTDCDYCYSGTYSPDSPWTRSAIPGCTPRCSIAVTAPPAVWDCNDLDDTVYPEDGKQEICDEPVVAGGTPEDENCSGDANEELSATLSCEALEEAGGEVFDGYLTYNYDKDGDGVGYGSEDLPEGGGRSSCVCPYQEAGDQCANDGVSVGSAGECHVFSHGDCDDGDPGVYPIGDDVPLSEVLDGADTDCDGYVALVEMDCDADGFASWPANGISTSVRSVYDFSREGVIAPFPETPVTDCRDNLSATLAENYGFSESDILSCKYASMMASPGAERIAECRRTVFRAVQVTCGDVVDVDTYCSMETGLVMLFKGDVSPLGAASSPGDCDDTCPDRNPGEDEVCDGLDNNCSESDFADLNLDSIPSPLDPDEEATRTGTVAAAEADPDLDGYVECVSGDPVPSTAEPYVATGSCGADSTVRFEDCNVQCAIAHPNAAEERCDGFMDICDGPFDDPLYDDDDLTDNRGDGHMACGAGWDDDPRGELEGSEIGAEDIYVLVYVPWSTPDGDSESGITARRSADTATHTGGTAAHTGDTATHSGDTGSGVTLAPDLAGMVPMVLPRAEVICDPGGTAGSDEVPCRAVRRGCDDPLYDAQIDALGAAAVTDDPSADLDAAVLLAAHIAQTEATDPSDDAGEEGFGLDADEDPLLSLCIRTSVAATADTASRGTCAVMRLTLDDLSTDAYTPPADYLGCDLAVEDGAPDGVEPGGEVPEAVVQTVWSRSRILEARRRVMEWECFRLWGTWGCTGDSPADWDGPATAGDFPSQGGLYVAAPDLTGAGLDFSAKGGAWESEELAHWWLELGRFNAQPVTGLLNNSTEYTAKPESVADGSLAGCWGEVLPGMTDLSDLSSKVGGDCDITDPEINRDHWEGPNDPIALYWGVDVSCEICFDGDDNNCDGDADADDPSCAPCYEGFGTGCAASSDKGGCTVTDLNERRRLGTSALLGVLAGLGALMFRGRRA